MLHIKDTWRGNWPNFACSSQKWKNVYLYEHFLAPSILTGFLRNLAQAIYTTLHTQEYTAQYRFSIHTSYSQHFFVTAKSIHRESRNLGFPKSGQVGWKQWGRLRWTLKSSFCVKGLLSHLQLTGDQKGDPGFLYFITLTRSQTYRLGKIFQF